MLLPPVFCSPNKQHYNNHSRFFWGTYSINSESVVATVHELRSPSLGKCKSVRFSDDSGPDKAPSKAKGLPQHSQHQPLPHHRVIPNLVDEKQVQEKKILTKSTRKQTPPCFKSRTYVVPHPTTERRKQASLPAGSLPGKHGPNSKETKDYDERKHQKAISKPTDNLRWDTLHCKAISPVIIHPEHCQRLQLHKEPENNEKTTRVKEQQGTPFRFLPYRKPTHVQEHFPANTVHYCKNRPQLSQPAQPSIFNTKPYKCSKWKGSVPTGLPLKKDIAKSDMHNTLKKDLGVGAQKVPGTASSSPGKEVRPKKPALRTEKVSSKKPTEHYSLPEAKRASNFTELPVVAP